MAAGKRKKKSIIIPYDYEAAYQAQLEALDEYFIEQMLKNGKRNIYQTKEIRSGEQLEVEIYPIFTKEQKAEIPKEGLKKDNRKAMKNLNEKNSRKACERTINENFGDDDIWMTMTYADNELPADMKAALKDMQNYIRRVNYERKKRGLGNAKYVYVTEYSPEAEVRWHHHIVMDGAMDMDTVEKLWKKGDRNEVRRLNKDENGLSGMANYMAKPAGKPARNKGEKVWKASKNLKKPKERVNHYKFKQKHIDMMVRDHDEVEAQMLKWYGKEGYIFTRAEIRYNDFNNRFYIYARLRNENARNARKRGKRQNEYEVCAEKRRHRADHGDPVGAVSD